MAKKTSNKSKKIALKNMSIKHKAKKNILAEKKALNSKIVSHLKNSKKSLKRARKYKNRKRLNEYIVKRNESLATKKRSKHKKRIRVTATAYTSHRNQTDRTPFLAAWNNRIRPGMKIIAVSHDLIRKYGLTNGVRVKIKGLKGYYVVRDKMNKRFRNRVDLYMGVNKRRALRWGKRRITIVW